MFLLDGQNNSVVVNGGEKVRDVSDRSPSIDPIRSDPIRSIPVSIPKNPWNSHFSMNNLEKSFIILCENLSWMFSECTVR